MAYGKTKKWMIGGAALAGTAVLTAALWQGLTLRRYALHTDKLSAPVHLLLLTDHEYNQVTEKGLDIKIRPVYDWVVEMGKRK